MMACISSYLEYEFISMGLISLKAKPVEIKFSSIIWYISFLKKQKQKMQIFITDAHYT